MCYSVEVTVPRTRPTKETTQCGDQEDKSRDSIEVTINVENVDETPTFTDGDTAISYEEGAITPVGTPYDRKRP